MIRWAFQFAPCTGTWSGGLGVIQVQAPKMCGIIGYEEQRAPWGGHGRPRRTPYMMKHSPEMGRELQHVQSEEVINVKGDSNVSVGMGQSHQEVARERHGGYFQVQKQVTQNCVFGNGAGCYITQAIQAGAASDIFRRDVSNNQVGKLPKRCGMICTI
jgi:hypothetical protein